MPIKKRPIIKASQGVARRRTAMLGGEAISDGELIRKALAEKNDAETGLVSVPVSKIIFNPRINPRPPEYVTDATTQGLYEQIKTMGQLTPIQLRPAPGDADKYELVYGSRRLYVCTRLKIPVRAIVSTMTDIEAIISAVGENTERESLALVHNARAIAGYRDAFDTVEAFANAFHMKRRQAFVIINMGKVPTSIIALFPKPENITSRLVSDLVVGIKENQPDPNLGEELEALADKYIDKHGPEVLSAPRVTTRLKKLLNIAVTDALKGDQIRHPWLNSGSIKTSGNEIVFTADCKDKNKLKSMRSALGKMLKETRPK